MNKVDNTMTEVCSGDRPFHGCIYSRSIDQEYPRKCIKCSVSEQAAVEQVLTEWAGIKPHFVSLENSKVKNFSMVRHEQSCINVYDKGCNGCISTNADFMLTFGSTIDVLGGNNKAIDCEGLKHVDVFITEKQARGLLEQLKRKLQE